MKFHTLLTMFRILAILLLGLSSAFAAGRKDIKTSFTFHIQDSGGTESKKLIFSQLTAGQNISYRVIPALATKDIVAFKSFPSDDGSTFGVVLQLKPSAASRLASLSTANQGSWLLAQANGRVVDAVQIDRPVSDGQLIIWKSMTAQEIELLDKEFPQIGEDPKDWKQRLKGSKKKKE